MLTSHGAHVIELSGDEAVAAFHSAQRALRSAVDLQASLTQTLDSHPDPVLDVGVGLDAGEAVPVETGYRGRALNLAARLCGVAAPGEVLASEGVVRLAGATAGLVYDHRATMRLKGIPEPVRVVAVRAAQPGLAGSALAYEVPASPDRPVLNIQLLGGFRVMAGDRRIDDAEWRLKKASTLVKLLALRPGHFIRREQLYEVLWPDLAPAEAESSLHYALSIARGVLEPSASQGADYIRLQGELVVLAPGADLSVDVDAFDAAAARARSSGSLEAYREAIALYGGDLLPDDVYEEWPAGRREELAATHRALLSELDALHKDR